MLIVPRFLLMLLFLTSSQHSQQLSTRSRKGVLQYAAGAPFKGAQIHLIGGHGEIVAKTQADWKL